MSEAVVRGFYESDKLVQIYFCCTCGTKTHMLFKRFTGSVGDCSGALDNRNWLEHRPDNTLLFYLSAASKGPVMPTAHQFLDAHYWNPMA